MRQARHEYKEILMLLNFVFLASIPTAGYVSLLGLTAYVKNGEYGPMDYRTGLLLYPTQHLVRVVIYEFWITIIHFIACGLAIYSHLSQCGKGRGRKVGLGSGDVVPVSACVHLSF